MNNKESNEEKLQQFISENGYGEHWFAEFVDEYTNQARIKDIIEKKEYLAGDHKIMNRPPEMFNGKLFDTCKIPLNLASRLIEYAASFLIGNGITYSGDKELVQEIQKIYKRVFAAIDFDIVQKVYSYGNAWEYVYLKDNKVVSKLLDVADSYPIITDDGEYIAFIECYEVGNVKYWNVYSENHVDKYSNIGGDIRYKGTCLNSGGLPIIYRNENPLNDVFGRSDLDDYTILIDKLEELTSKSYDAFYKHITGIPVLKGQLLKGDDTLPVHIVGGGMVIDSDAEFFFANNEFDHEAFKTLFDYLLSQLMSVSGTPSVAFGQVEISNISTVSLKLLYSVANLKAKLAERYIKEGIYERLDKLKRIFESQGKHFTDEQWESITITFSYAMPSSESDIISDLTKLREINAISMESLQKHNPYVSDIGIELERLQSEHANNTVTISKQTS